MPTRRALLVALRGALGLTLTVCSAALIACGSDAASTTAGPVASASASARGAADEMECASCHMAEFQSAHGHVGKRPTKCAVCHTSDAWHPRKVLDHRWPLTGAHAKANCFDCHKGDPAVFEGTPKACVGCHQADYDKAPGHAGRRPTTCQDCHGTTAWKPPLSHEEAPPSSSGDPATANTHHP
jgi:hypothetical protein